MNKFLYFRAVSTIGDDDGINDSVLINVDKIRGVEIETYSGDHYVNIWYDSLANDNNPNTYYKSRRDTTFVRILIDSLSGTQRGSILKALAELTNAGPHDDGVVVVADDVTGTYWHPAINSVTLFRYQSQSGSDYDSATEV